MRRIGDLVLGVAVIGLLSLSTGCARKSEAGLDAKTAAVNGGGAKATTESSPSSSSSSPASQALPPARASDPLHPLVEIQTSLGNITVELDAAEADGTVRNFLQYVDSGHYDQTIFHQVLKDYVIMGGGYAPASQPQAKPLEKRPHPPIRNQAEKCRLKNTAGTISMVRKPDVIDSATCQFFINVTDNPNLDYKGPKAEEYGYCPFGKVTSGMDVVRKIAEVEVSDAGEFERIPKQNVVIQSVRRVR
jgi:cyclophilin family peptidyl-prolyl cis-trans isomerase